MRRRRSGFSLIEILIVIGVILVLIGIAVVSYRTIEANAASRSTRATLENLRSMLSELDAEAGSSAMPGYQDASNPANPVNIIGIGITSPDGQNWTVGDVTSGNANDRYGIVVQHTQLAMATLMRSPKNKQAVAQLPSRQLLRDAGNNAYPPTTGPVLLDAWNNPIIYVPRGGIWVSITAGSAQSNLLIKTSDGRPFFSSAGPDGNFGATVAATQSPTPADDNLYSTGN